MGIATFISRILGLVRDTLVGHLLGAKWISDAFYVAFRIPNIMRQLLGEGALSNAFIPVFCRTQHEEGRESAFLLARATLSWLYLLLFTLSILGMFASPLIVRLFTLGVSPEGGLIPLAVELTRIMFPFFIFIGLAAVVMATLNSLDHFFIPGLAPASFNIILIIAAIAAPFISASPETHVRVLAMAVLLGGASQFLVMLPSLRSENFSFKAAWKHPGLNRIFKMMGPAVFGQSVVQITLVINTVLGWLVGEGAITALNYANRLMNFPLGVLGVSIAQTSVPTMSRHVARDDIDGLKQTLHSLLRSSAFIMIPAGVGLMVLSTPIIRLLFQHGRFDAVATAKTAGCLYWFATGLLFFTLVKVIVPVFYAFDDTRTPVFAAVASMIFNVGMNIALMGPMKEAGLAFATALTSLVNVLILSWFLRRRLGRLGLTSVLPAMLQILAFSILMGWAAWGMSSLFEPATGHLLRLVQVIVSILTGVIVYGVLTAASGMPEFHQGWAMLRRRFDSRRPSA